MRVLADDQPLVSVVIPCYNHDKYIQRSIHSIIDQDYQNIELIVIDDGSKDSSVEQIRKMIAECELRFKRFEFRHRPNKGLSSTLNEGISAARGKYICFCSSDDFYHLEKIKKQVAFLEENYGVKCCFSEINHVDANGSILVDDTEVANKRLKGKITFKDILTFRVHLPITSIYSMEFLRNTVGGFDQRLSAEDYDMNLKVALATEIYILPERLYYYLSPSQELKERNRPVMRLDVSESHFKTLAKYHYHPAYEEALLEWNFRRFVFFAKYSSTKIYALKGMVRSLRFSYRFAYQKAFLRFLFSWGKY